MIARAHRTMRHDGGLTPSAQSRVPALLLTLTLTPLPTSGVLPPFTVG